MSTPHSVTAYDAELTALRTCIETMGQVAERLVGDAVRTLDEGDPSIARSIVAGEAELDRLDDEADRMIVRLLALRQPMANDLRMVISALRIAPNLERIGDLAAGIALHTSQLVSGETATPMAPTTKSLARIGRMVHAMVRDVVTACATGDAALAREVRGRDGEVDAAYTSLFRELLTYMMEKPTQVGICTHLMFAAKAIERIGDHATNVAEQICYREEGQHILDPRAKQDTTAFTTTDGDD